MSDVIEAMIDGWFEDQGISFPKRMEKALRTAEKAGWRLVPVEPTEEMLDAAGSPAAVWLLKRAVQAAPRPWDEVRNDS